MAKKQPFFDYFLIISQKLSTRTKFNIIFHKIFHSHSTPKRASACAKASKSYDWAVRNIARRSPKMAKKQPFFDFTNFYKTLHNIRRKFSTVILRHIKSNICAIASKSYDWDVRSIAKITPKMAKKQSFFDFFRFSQKPSIRFERNFLQSFYTILWSSVCNFIKFQ